MYDVLLDPFVAWKFWIDLASAALKQSRSYRMRGRKRC